MAEGRPPPGHPGYEREDWRPRPVVLAALGVLLLALVAHLLPIPILVGSQALFRRLDPLPSPLLELREPPPPPRLRRSPASEMERLRAGFRRLKESYGWMDRERGLVRVPIRVAMEYVLEHGLPTFPAEAEGRGGEEGR